jgi:hypothetical protein
MNRLKALGMLLLDALIGFIFMGFLVFMALEWAAGCGETYVDSEGVRHQYECLFINR